MNTHSTVLNDVSAEPTTPDRILQTALAAWRQGNFVATANQFNDQFTFENQPKIGGSSAGAAARSGLFNRLTGRSFDGSTGDDKMEFGSK